VLSTNTNLPMNVIQEINRINQRELQEGLTNTPASWHAKYSTSAWVYVGNMPNQLTEGDTIAIMSQYGEIEDINLVREEGTGKSRGFGFVKYDDCKSCVLAVDNFNGSMVLGRSLRVDHVENYRLPKHLREKEEQGESDDSARNERIDQNGELKAGHAYHGSELANGYNINLGHDLFAPAQNEINEDEANAHQAGEAKLQRKTERDRIRKEREVRRQQREDNRRQKRAKTLSKGEKDVVTSEQKQDDNRGKRNRKHNHKNSDKRRPKKNDRDRHPEVKRKRLDSE